MKLWTEVFSMLQMCCATCPSNQPRCMCRQHHERRTNRCNGRRTHLLVLATPITSVFLNYSIHNSTLHLCGNCQPSIFFVNFFGKSSMGQCVVPRRFGDGISTITNQRIACIGGFNAALAAVSTLLVLASPTYFNASGFSFA